MTRSKKGFLKLLHGFILVLGLICTQQSFACGGFFCDVVPINQAGEQIVFRQEGNQTTAMIKIDYVGNAEDFGWVLPVPQTPEISLGRDEIFNSLELATRPVFSLTRDSHGCATNSSSSTSSSLFASSSAASSASSMSGVIIEKFLSVGPFDAQVISSDDPTALAQWLSENNLDLSDQGSELLAPYIAANQKFVVLKLKNNTNVGSIQPIILKYTSDAPVIPLTLTAVAAQRNMGILVWLLGEGRGVPVNFKHVIPNYSRINWYRGGRLAYSSYQTLITQAMDEVGGQGFATDFAGYMPNLSSSLPSVDGWISLLEESSSKSDSEFVELMWNSSAPAAVRIEITNALPTSNQFIYSDATIIEQHFGAEQLATARANITRIFNEQVIEPYNNALDILDDNLYLTRLYTTISPDEMSENPVFSFNTAMEDQPRTRRATLFEKCYEDGRGDEWTMTLGEGTGRNGELVMEGWNVASPSFSMNQNQLTAWRIEKTSATSDPVILLQNDFPVEVVSASSVSSTSSESSSSFESSSSSSEVSSAASASSDSSSAATSSSSSSSLNSNSSSSLNSSSSPSEGDSAGSKGGSFDGLLLSIITMLFMLGYYGRVRK